MKDRAEELADELHELFDDMQKKSITKRKLTGIIRRHYSEPPAKTYTTRKLFVPKRKARKTK